MKVTVTPIINSAFGTICRGLEKGPNELAKKEGMRLSRQRQIIKIGKNNVQNPGDLMRLDVIQTPMKKVLKGVKYLSNGTPSLGLATRPSDSQQKRNLANCRLPAVNMVKVKKAKRKMYTWTLLENGKKNGIWK